MVNPILLASGDDITMDTACSSVYPDLCHVYFYHCHTCYGLDQLGTKQPGKATSKQSVVTNAQDRNTTSSSHVNHVRGR